MRVAQSELVLLREMQAARSEAEAAFKDGRVYLERFVERPPPRLRFRSSPTTTATSSISANGTAARSAVTRSWSRRAPARCCPKSSVRRWGEAAVRLCKAANYRNAGTVEFLLDSNGEFYFMELNSRLQVEHPVTELITGIDIVREQIRIAAGEPLSITQDDVRIEGHAIECRINAEDPDQGFRPSPGRVGLYVPPGGPGVRVDSHLYSGYRVPSHYDSMVAKLLVHRATREEAIETMQRALGEYIIEGIKTTIPLYQRLLDHAAFRSGDIDTHFVETEFMPS